MKKKYRLNDEHDALILDDSYRIGIIFATFAMLLQVLTAIVYIVKANFSFTDGIVQIHTVTATICIVCLIWFKLKKTTKNIIPLTKIIDLKERNIMGQKRYSLCLTNGKRRNLNIDARTDIKEYNFLKSLLEHN